MRGPERSIDKPDNTYRIALLGDSFAFGWKVEQEKIFANILEQTLNELTGGNPKVEVLNFGVPGYSTFQEVAHFEESGIEFDPDAVLVFFIDNDFGLPFFIKNFSNPNKLGRGHNFESYKKRATEGKAKERKDMFQHYLNPNTSLERLADLSKKKGFKLF